MLSKPRFFKNDSEFREQAELCVKFFKDLTTLLKDDYETMGSGKMPWNFFVEGKDKGIFRLNDHYLFPFGTKDQITYYTKPYWSFRISDHWNWYEPVKRCKQKNYIQCFNVDLPRISTRYVDENTKSEPWNAIQVAIFGNHKDEAYHCVYGSYMDKSTHTWKWMDNTPENVIAQYSLI